MRDLGEGATLREAEIVAAMHRLNALYIRALARSDATWFSEHLSDGFFCTLPDGRRIGKIEYVQEIEDRRSMGRPTVDEIDVHPLGDIAVVQGVMHSSSGSDRYTHVWQSQNCCWRVVIAHMTRLVGR